MMFVIIGTVNAVNLTDGLDGLASGITLIVSIFFMLLAISVGNSDVAILAAATGGACLGFLGFNAYPARIFMGDTGSLLLGGVISGMALYLKMPLILLVIALIPVLETLSVIMQVVYFKKTGKRIFKMAPLHHHFELSGWKENKVVIVFSLVTLVLCIVGLKII